MYRGKYLMHHETRSYASPEKDYPSRKDNIKRSINNNSKRIVNISHQPFSYIYKDKFSEDYFSNMTQMLYLFYV